MKKFPSPPARGAALRAFGFACASLAACADEPATTRTSASTHIPSIEIERHHAAQADAEVPGVSDGGVSMVRTGPRLLTVVAHEDDDLLFTNPDLVHSIERGAVVRTIYMEGGNEDLPCLSYAANREEGVKRAYASMAGVPSVWSGSLWKVGDHHVRELSLEGTRISLVFVGLRAGTAHDLRALWDHDIAQISTWEDDTRRPLETYTRDEIADVLRQLIEEFAPTEVHVNDASELRAQHWPYDHPDHVHAGLFALLALERYREHPPVRMYRAYNIQFEPANLSDEDEALKWQVFQTYAEHDAKMCEKINIRICGTTVECNPPSILYKPFSKRKYGTGLVRGSGQLTTPSGLCLLADGKTALEGACTSADAWQLGTDDTVRTSEGACLTANPALGAQVTLAPCSALGAQAQRFRLTEEGQLRGPGASCVRVRNSALELAECADSAVQRTFSLSKASN